jgi:antitoxin component of MazEF toxin-antitoxin module
MSTIVKAGADGTVTLPADLCRAAGMQPGADLVAEVDGGRVVLGPARQTLAERIAALTADAPSEELDKLPTDGASQHDHYLYGTPKRPETPMPPRTLFADTFYWIALLNPRETFHAAALAKAIPPRNRGHRLLFPEMTRCFHRLAHTGGPMEAERCFFLVLSAVFASRELSRRPLDCVGVVCARRVLHHSRAAP